MPAAPQVFRPKKEPWHVFWTDGPKGLSRYLTISELTAGGQWTEDKDGLMRASAGGTPTT